MKAVVYSQYGAPDVLQFKEVEKPAPKAGEVLIQVCAVSLNSADLHLLKADPFLVRLMAGGLFQPKYPILGADIAGRVVALGAGAEQFRVGDEVFGDISASGWGGLGEYVCAAERLLALKPANLSFEQAAAIPMAACTALQALRDYGQVRAGSQVVINGAAGGVGTFAVQIARLLGAEVTAVCSSRNLDQARAIGADHVVDYTKEDFTRSGRQYDLILAANGYHPLGDYRRALKPNGVYVMVGGTGTQMFEAMVLGPWFSRGGGQKMGSMLCKLSQKDLVLLKEWVEAGKIKPVIDRTYPLSQAVEAFRHVDSGHARGKVVISMLGA